MRTWKELEQDFRALHQPHEGELDHQFGADGERWTVRCNSPHNAAVFESLAAIAGAKVLELQAAGDWPEILQEKDATTRWYLCLKRLSGVYKANMEITSTPAQPGQEPARTYVANLNRVFSASAALCVQMESLVVAPRLRLEALCAVPRYAGPCQQWTSAQGFLTAREPNLAQAVADAVHAVEGLARILLNDPKITLGDAAKELRLKRGLHPALSNVIERVYGYASDEGGIRHGATAPIQVADAEAHFAINVSEAALLLLLALDTSA